MLQSLLLLNYLIGRFLPDKAIDLVDEAAAARRVQLDSRPEKIDILERKIISLRLKPQPLPERRIRPPRRSARMYWQKLPTCERNSNLCLKSGNLIAAEPMS
jgi:ATP-dependent Clp protease ATP-binding subunit ClpB